VSEQDAALTSSESSSIGIVYPSSPDEQIELMATAPEAAAPEADAMNERPAAEASLTENLRVEATPDAPAFPARIIVVSDSENNDAGVGGQPRIDGPDQSLLGKRRFSALAAVVALAALTGALGGALATAALSHVAGGEPAGNENAALEASVARIEADILALASNVEHTSKAGIAQFNKASERLDKLEKAQAEPAAKLAKLNETIEKPRIMPPTPAATPVAAAKPEVTGSIGPAKTAVPAKLEVARLPTLDRWHLRDVAQGGALIEGRGGYYVVYAGDEVPGLGRVDAIRRQDGHWVVVTSKGLVVAR
jgi:hypothetical protein